MSFHETSNDIRLDNGHVLVANAQRADGSVNQNAAIDLNDILGNDDGRFNWGGVNFSETARNIRFDIEGPGIPVLRALLQTVDGTWIESDVNLAERVENQDGNLVFI
ncbi:hypothetical protein RUND412_000820 [Rhizina undulata]